MPRGIIQLRQAPRSHHDVAALLHLLETAHHRDIHDSVGRTTHEKSSVHQTLSDHNLCTRVV